jgi:hypothetical protein
MSREVAIATASLTSGLLVREPEDSAAREQLQELAFTAPEIFGTIELGCLSRIAQRLGIETEGEELLELVLLSDSQLQVIHPLVNEPELALLAVSGAVGKIGLVLSEVHAQASALEDRK